MSINEIITGAHPDAYIRLIKLRRGRGSTPVGTTIEYRVEDMRASDFVKDEDVWGLLGDMPAQDTHETPQRGSPPQPETTASVSQSLGRGLAVGDRVRYVGTTPHLIGLVGEIVEILPFRDYSVTANGRDYILSHREIARQPESQNQYVVAMERELDVQRANFIRREITRLYGQTPESFPTTSVNGAASWEYPSRVNEINLSVPLPQGLTINEQLLDELESYRIRERFPIGTRVRLSNACLHYREGVATVARIDGDDNRGLTHRIVFEDGHLIWTSIEHLIPVT